ncbi:MAG TPA: ATP-dependent DNA ligase, partial [Steroidobacteraceae bacterium]|nr:ATP-dependent DNA ligase [Steroidobacteraceae bacterium]
AEIEIGVAYLAGELPQGKIGIGYATLRTASQTPASESPSLQLAQVDAALTTLAGVKGAGSTAARTKHLRDLFAAATQAEQSFLLKLLSGELRQGALAAVMTDGIAMAADIPIVEVRRAVMYAPTLGAVALAALHDERSALSRFQLATLSPVVPMLAETAEDIEDALQMLGANAVFEWKLDGARIQVHKRGDEVRVFTRNLNNVADAVPEVIEAVRAMPARELVLDGEVIALDSQGNPLPFQLTMRRFGRKLDVETLRRELPLYPFFFDCLRLDADSLVCRAVRERITTDLRQAERFYADALAKGHEGVMAKSLIAPYEAGKRGASWLKIKHTHTLDLVVLAAEWGSGRRTGKLSNLHLGARHPATGEFVMLGKTFKGLTDSMLEWQTKEFLAREVSRDSNTVTLRPELVVEIAFNDIQASSHYTGGYALRFARVKRYRSDKAASEADTIETVRSLYDAQSGVEAHKRFV